MPQFAEKGLFLRKEGCKKGKRNDEESQIIDKIVRLITMNLPMESLFISIKYVKIVSK